MKAVVYRRYGGPEVLEYVDVQDPKVSQNSVLIRVVAAGLNPADLAIQAGLADHHTDAWFPAIPGWDVAGVIETAGAGVTEFVPGDAVLGYIRQEIVHSGAYAEMVSTPVETVVRKPPEVSWSEAGGLPLAALTAYRAIVQTLEVKAGDHVLIHGTAGGVGILAAQLALRAGAQVVGTSSERNHAYLRDRGVIPVLYGDRLEDRVLSIWPAGANAIFDCYGHGVLASNSATAARDARVCTIADSTPGATTVFARADAAILREMVALMAAGELLLPIAATFALADAAEAQRALLLHHAPGKIVLRM